jgi:hypothetical protein
MKPDLLATSAVVRPDLQHALVQQDPELDGVEGLTLLGCEQVELEPTFIKLSFLVTNEDASNS